MIFDFHIYRTVADYMAHYKNYVKLPEFHTEIDSFYIYPDQLWISAELPDKFRPQFDKSVVIIPYRDITKFLKTDPVDQPLQVKFNETYYDPKLSHVLFKPSKLVKLIFKPKFIINAYRFYGAKVTKTTRIDYNWFIDSTNRRINLVISK